MSSLTNVPRSSTWECLQKSRNEAAIATLATGLTSTQDEMRHRCIKALALRSEPAARRAVLKNWERLNEADIEFLRAEGERFLEATVGLLNSGDSSEKRLALNAVSELEMSDACDALLDIVINPRHALRGMATECLLNMCRRLGQAARTGKDRSRMRLSVQEKLNKRLVIYSQYNNVDLIDAWLMLAHWDDSAQRGLISDPRHDAYRAALHAFSNSERPEILQLLAGYLWRSATPRSVLQILEERVDVSIPQFLAELLDDSSLASALRRLRELPPLASLRAFDITQYRVNFSVERRIWLLVSASSDDLAQVLRGAVRLSKTGTSEARQTAAAMLRGCTRPELEQLVAALQVAETDVIDSADPAEQTLGQLIHHIAKWLKSPSVVLVKAAEEFLKEFSLANLLDQVRQWPTQMCKAMASIVILVETEAAEILSRELQCPAPKRRLAALQATQLLGSVDQVSEQLMPLLDDPRLEVRVRVIDLLSALGHESLERLIPELLEDASTDIQDAANRAVRRLARQDKKARRQAAS